MKKFLVSALAVAGLAASANAQVDNSVQFQLRLVEVTYTGVQPSPQQYNTVANTAALVTGTNRTRYFELQYTLTDGDGSTFPAGLVSAVIDITGNMGTYQQALLTRGQAATGQPTSNAPRPLGATDSTGAPTGATANARGMEFPYRGGFSPVGNNASPGNGTIAPNGILQINPLTISQSLANPIFPNFYGLFLFCVTVPDGASGTFSITAAASADAQTGSAFAFFNDGDPAPFTSTNAASATATFLAEAVPAPASVALLGLGGLVAARRRRA